MSETTTRAEARLTGAQWRMLVLASLGGALEYYDFVVFGVFAASIGAAFFPAGDSVASQIAGYATFGVGYLARPLGGLIMAHLGDRTGRRGVFVGSVLAMSLATLGLGLLPGYAQIGVAAPVLLLVLRLIQGFCIGGELPGAVTYMVETVPPRAGAACGVIFGCVNTGVLLAALVSLLVNRLLPADVAAGWGWRIGFLIGGALGLVGYPLRRSLAETPAFVAMRDAVRKLPVGDVLRDFPLAVVNGVGIAAATGGFNGMLFAFLPGFLARTVHHDPVKVAAAQALGVAVYSVGVPVLALIGERVSRRLLLGIAAVALLVGSWPWFNAAIQPDAPLLTLFAIAGVVGSFTSGIFAVMMADLFPTRVRYSGIALSFNIAFTAFSGTVPLVAASLIAASGDLAAPALVVAFCAGLTLIATLFAHRYAGRLHS